MRVPAGRALRVGPGDEVVVRGQLASMGKLGRLYVFARECRGDYAPYVPAMIMEMAAEKPQMISPMSMRLVLERPVKQLSFVSDIDGFIRVMQEVDTADEPRARVKLWRTVCPDLPWHLRLSRKISGMVAWIH